MISAMRERTIRSGLLVIWLLCAAIAPCAAETLSAAGDGSHAFFATKVRPVGAPVRLLPGAGLGENAKPEYGSIYHLPADLEPGSIRHGPDLPWTPSAMATRNGRLVMVFEPDVDAAQTSGRAPSRLVRAISVRAGAVPGSYLYEPLGRDPEALASLPGEGALRGVALGSWGPVVLLTGSGSDERARVLALRGVEWEDVPLPAGADLDTRFELTTRNGEPALLMQAASAGSAATLCTLKRANADSDEWTWETEPCAPAREDERVAAVGRSLVAWSRGPEGSVRLRLLRESGGYDLSPVTGVSERFCVVPGDQRVNVVWLSRERNDGVDREIYRVAVVSTVTGKALYEGPARTGTALSGRDLQTLALLAGAVMLTVLVLVLRPSPDETGAVALPGGMSLAEPWKRAAAVLIDLLPGMFLAALVFNVPAEDLAAAAAMSADSTPRPVLAFLTGIVLTAVHEILGEWLAGRSLGKWAVGCRVITLSGGRPAIWQAAVRTLLKLFCPPLALFVLLDARRRHPADILARTVVVSRAPEPKGTEGDGRG